MLGISSKEYQLISNLSVSVSPCIQAISDIMGNFADYFKSTLSSVTEALSLEGKQYTRTIEILRENGWVEDPHLPAYFVEEFYETVQDKKFFNEVKAVTSDYHIHLSKTSIGKSTRNIVAPLCEIGKQANQML